MNKQNKILSSLGSELINEAVETRDAWLEWLSGSDRLDQGVGLRALFHWISAEFFPMIEHALWESSAWGGGSEWLGETEWLSDWQVGLHLDKRCSLDWLFTNDNTSSLGEALIDGADGVIGSLDLNQEDWLLEPWRGGKLAGIEVSSSGRDNLTTSSMDGIIVERNIMNVDSDTSPVLIA